MRYLKYTHVDALTGRPATERPARNGPVAPAVKGLAFAFGDESRWPVAVPTLYGTCDDDADLTVPGVLGELTAEAFEAARTAELLARADQRRAALVEHLAAVDLASVRPLRAVAAGTATDADRERLAALDAEAATLRAELATV